MIDSIFCKCLVTLIKSNCQLKYPGGIFLLVLAFYKESSSRYLTGDKIAYKLWENIVEFHYLCPFLRSTTF